MQTQSVHIKLPKETHDALERCKEKTGWSMAQIIRYLVTPGSVGAVETLFKMETAK